MFWMVLSNLSFQHGVAHVLQGLTGSVAELGLEQAKEVFLVREAVTPGDLGDMRLGPIGIRQHLISTPQPLALYLAHDAATAFEQLVKFCPRQPDVPANAVWREIGVKQMRIDIAQDPIMQHIAYRIAGLTQ